MIKVALIIFCLAYPAWSRVIDDAGNEDRNEAMELEGYFEGDIAGFDPEDRNAETYTKALWPYGKVYYTIHANLARYRSVITSAMAEWTQKTRGCITFQEGTGYGNYIYFESGHGCHSHIGMRGGDQLISLGVGCRFKGIALHEIGHALGLFHEQTRSDRNQYVRILSQNVKEGYLHNFRINSANKNYLFTKYDYGSIMEYGKKSFSKNGLDTIEPLYKTTVFGQRRSLSQGDASTIMALYNCYGRQEPAVSAKSRVTFYNQVADAHFRKVTSGDKYYYYAAGKELDYRLETRPMEYHGAGHICIQFNYRIIGTDQLSEVGIVDSADQVGKIILSLTTTSKWVHKKSTVKIAANNPFRVYFDARPGAKGSFSMSDFSYSDGACEN